MPRLGLVPLLIIASACGPDAGGSGGRSSGEDLAGGPYVVTAVDYHFHDAHPSLPIALGRVVEFSNQGSNQHNVTIPGTGFHRNVRPGARFAIRPIGALFREPGRYPFFCALHVDRGMKGVLVVTRSG